MHLGAAAQHIMATEIYRGIEGVLINVDTNLTETPQPV